jgi:hypothetical protein
MSKRTIIAILAALVVLVGGFFVFLGYRQFQDNQAYQKSANKVADDLVKDLVANNPQAGMALFTDSLRAQYGDAYWAKQFFPLFKDLKTPPAPQKIEQVKPTAAQPATYGQGVDAWRFTYQVKIGGLDYILTLVAARKGTDPWKVSELYGDYKAGQ